MALPTDPISYIDTVASPFLISLKNDEPKLLKEGDGFISENESKADARGNQGFSSSTIPSPCDAQHLLRKRPRHLVAAGQRKKGNTLQCQASTGHKRSGGWRNEQLAPFAERVAR